MTVLRTCVLAASVMLGGFVQTGQAGDASARLAEVVAARSAEDRARDAYRRPVETLTFFRVEPGMTVAEGLPGGGWYTRILANYLGGDGALYGVSYPEPLWAMYRPDNPEWAAERAAAILSFAADVASYTDNGISAQGFTFASVPPEVNGTVDRVLLIRALHNLYRFEDEVGTLTQALDAIKAMLKPDGLVGVVQHRAPATASAEWADGQRAYLREASVIAKFEAAGFELVASSEINANPLDVPGEADSVWRLPPALRGSEDDPELRAAMLAIGESDRMTLLFRVK